MVNEVTIKKAKGGYIYIDSVFGGEPEIIVSIEELFERLLLHFEGKADTFHGDSYGKVIIDRNEPKT